MFCQSCGSKNNDGSRFCNMCGAPLAAPRASLDQTQLGVGETSELAIAIAESRRSSMPDAAPSRSSSPGTTQRSPSLASIDGNESTLRASDGFAPVPSTRPHGAWAATSQSMKAVEVPEGFDPSLSVQLDAIGIRSPRRMWVAVAIAAAVLLALGGLSSYLATRDDPSEGHARAGDPFEIGAPTADVDYVTGSNGTPTAIPSTAAPSDDAGTRARLPSPLDVTSNGVATAPSTTTTTSSPSTMGSTPVSMTALPPPSIPVDPTPIPTPSRAPVTPPPSTTPVTPTTAVTPPPATGDTTVPSETTPEMDAEMYAARVRYLVRRYYAGRAQSCFSAATARNETVSGQVVIGMHIGADGHVTSTRVARNTTGDDALGSCLADQASSWELAPPPGGAADLSFPFSR